MDRHMLQLLILGLLVLMCGLPYFIKQEDDFANCSGTAPCSLAFLSDNPLSLRCPGATEVPEGSVYWQYQDFSQPQAKPRTFIGPGHLRVYHGPMGELARRADLRRGSLNMNKAWTSDTGLFLCKSTGSILAAYQVDVQDSSLLHVSHQGLGEIILSNRSLRVNFNSSRHMVQLYTRWGPWQDCDRCNILGEQKMMGFCYAKLNEIDEDEQVEVNGATLPCGLMELHIGQSLPRRGAELHYRMCREPCEKEETPEVIIADLLQDISDWWWWLLGQETAFDGMEPRTWLMESIYLNIHGYARMICPGASVYTPVLWQRDSTFITRHGNRKGTHRLDDATGGGTYQIESVMPFDLGIYRCWVHRRRTASFNLMMPKQPVVHRHINRRLLNGMIIMVGTIGMVFMISAVAEILHA